MMVKYSPDAADRLRQIKNELGKKTAGIITGKIRSLSDNPRIGASIENMLGISSPFYFLHTENHYVFYKFDDNTVYVDAIYNEREDFLWKMFRIRLRTQDSIDYWGE